MGEEEVIVLKDAKGKVRVFKNWCPHRGNKVGLFDRGNARAFTCTFHGWTYDLDGKLIGFGAGKELYGGLEAQMRAGKRLPEVPNVSSYSGLIFASWDRNAPALEDYLGDIRPYLDVVAGRPWSDGVEVLPGRARWIFPINWKAIAENWMSDDYHVWTTHASFFRIAKGMGSLGEFVSAYASPDRAVRNTVNVLASSPCGAPHALGAVSVWGDPRAGTAYHTDFVQKGSRPIAEGMGKEALEWYEDSIARIGDYMRKESVAKFCNVGNMTVFPNLSLELLDIVLGGACIIQWQPRGATLHQGCQWVLVENAPDIVKRYGQTVVNLGQSPAGMVMIDDTENFERVSIW
jgi:hypothetical protein